MREPKPKSASQSDALHLLAIGKELDEFLALNILGMSEKELTDYPKFSQSIDAAWKLVEAIEQKIQNYDLIPEMDFLTLESFGEGQYTAKYGEYWWAESSTPAHAICLASFEAYKAIEIELEKKTVLVKNA
jgi:hypothetical protein